MSLKRKLIIFFLFLSFSLVSYINAGLCQVALNAPPEDPVYKAIDTFIAHGLVKDVIIGQRPYSRLEVARILKNVRKKFDESRDSTEGYDYKKYSRHISKIHYLESLLKYYENEYAVELSGMPQGVRFEALSRLDFTQIYNSSEPRTVPVVNGEGAIDAVVTSFDQYDQGITYVDGSNTFIFSQHNLYLTPYLAITAQPRFEFNIPRNGSDQYHAYVHRLYLKTGWRNFEVEIGRDNLLWGQSDFGGMMVSTNARPLDMLKISNPYPWTWPWIFKYLGPMKFTLFVSNLGPDREFPYAYFYGLKWTLRPSRCFEMGLSETVIMGGRGAPKISFWDPVTELFPFHKWGASNIGAADVSDHAFGFLDFRITIPPLRNSIIYYDGYIEDSIIRAFRLPDNLLNQMGFIAGWYSPRLTESGNLGLRLEYHHTPPLAYKHGRWTSGYTLNQRVIGDTLGPDADAIYATLYWRPKPTFLAQIEFAFEDYDSSIYATETGPDGTGDRIVKVESRPHERRYRSVVSVDWLGNKRYGLKLQGGYERIENWDFNVGRSVNNMMIGAVLSLKFDEFNFNVK